MSRAISMSRSMRDLPDRLLVQECALDDDSGLLSKQDHQAPRIISQGLTPPVAPSGSGTAGGPGGPMTANRLWDAYELIAYPDSQLGISIADAKGEGLPARCLASPNRSDASRPQSAWSADCVPRSLGSANCSSAPCRPGIFVTNVLWIIDVAERRMSMRTQGILQPHHAFGRMASFEPLGRSTGLRSGSSRGANARGLCAFASW